MQQFRLNSAAALTADGADSTPIRRVETDDTEWLVAPTVAIQEDVYRYRADGGGTVAEYLPADELAATATEWDGKPLLLDHPENPQGQATVIANGDAVAPTEIGEVRNPHVEDGRLKAEAWLDLSEAGAHGGAVQTIADALEAGRIVETSTGYLADRPAGRGTLNGQSYEAVQRNLQPDHLAVFAPTDDAEGNCSVAGGCGIGRLNNGMTDTTDGDDVAIDDAQAATLGRRVLNALGVGDTAPESEAADCTCDDGGSSPTTNEDHPPADDDAADDTAEAAEAAGDTDADPDTDPDATTTDDSPDDMTPDTDDDTADAEATEAEADADTEQPEPETDTQPEAPTAEADGGDDADITLADLNAKIEALEEENQELREAVEAPQRETQSEAAEAVANEFGVDASEIDLSTEAAQAILNERQAAAQPPTQQGQATANMAAVPGQVERTNDAPEDDAPAGGFGNWQAQEGED